MIFNDLFSQILIFLTGLAVGSFVNCLTYRFHLRGVSPPKAGPFHLGGGLGRRSFCDACGRQLSWRENIPVLSWLILKGRCLTCHSPIPYQYPIVEFLTGMIFWGVWSVWGARGDWEVTIFWWVVSVVLMVVFVSDWLYGIIPDVVVLPASLIAALFSFFLHGGVLIPYLLSASGAALFFYTIVFLSRGQGMGLGDVKLAFFMGLVLGWPKILISIWLAFVIGALFASFLLILQKKKLSDTIALGPFLVIGTFLALFFGERLWFVFLPI